MTTALAPTAVTWPACPQWCTRDHDDDDANIHDRELYIGTVGGVGVNVQQRRWDDTRIGAEHIVLSLIGTVHGVDQYIEVVCTGAEASKLGFALAGISTLPEGS